MLHLRTRLQNTFPCKEFLPQRAIHLVCLASFALVCQVVTGKGIFLFFPRLRVLGVKLFFLFLDPGSEALIGLREFWSGGNTGKFTASGVSVGECKLFTTLGLVDGVLKTKHQSPKL